MPSHIERIVPGPLVEVNIADADLPNGECKGLWVGVAGNANLSFSDGTSLDDVPLQVGLFPVPVTRVRPGASPTAAANIYAIY